MKYGQVNSLLAVICAVRDLDGRFFDPNGNAIKLLDVAPIKRKLTDKQKRNFSIVGHNTTQPILIARVDELVFDVYFNHHFFVQPKYHQYFPSASVILRPRNFLKWDLVSSPGSWGSDTIALPYDWDGTFVFEASEFDLTGQVRRNFQGYKFVPAYYKSFLSRRRLPLSEQKLLINNGFRNVIITDNLNACGPVLLVEVARFIQDQNSRLLPSPSPSPKSTAG